ncbi:molybdate transport system permease protein [Geoalkalibacter ferrihydriticus]|uniref:Molybdenum transport system permease n=2 Tax=Geoalkalibacter ferrihydriticus TaxID=392333 RepID=A0A0C2DRN4_9BACT|nr:molybdate ABC transporter permease subunit [Geoalkalibacter ferrihydriticus]KIH76119.1 molybdenum ABC transporter permease [Geoalkalibacter ferrihydriticus DSM 17813]SDM44442.1 molybdate transport system permease protein [Geoalkalibacter ferrihydriticus]
MFDFTPTDYQAMALSAKVALVATMLSLPLGFAAAWLLVFSRVPGKALIDGIINLPLVLPPVVVGYLLLLTLGSQGWLGGLLDAWGIRVIFTWKAAVLASMVVGFPLLVRSIRLGMESIDERLIQASRTLGAPWYDTLLTVILPLSTRALIAGATLMFARSLGEFGATIIVAGNIPGVTQTIPLAIYDYTNTPGGDRMALALCAVSILLALAVLLFNEGLVKRFKRGELR